MKNYLSGNLYCNTSDYYDFDNRDLLKDDLDFYVEYANRTKGAILELASGTGRVSLYIAEKTNRILDCVELSEYMVEKFINKLKTSHKNLQNNIRIHKGDMSNFNLDRKFEYIIIPWRTLQLLPVREKTIDCFNCVYEHLADNGIFIFDVFKPRDYSQEWLGKEDVSYDIIDGNRRIIRSTVNQYADIEKKYIQYKIKIKILEMGVESMKEDLLTLKYYDYDEMVDLLKGAKFNIKEVFGYYDKRSLQDGEEMIFVCTK